MAHLTDTWFELERDETYHNHSLVVEHSETVGAWTDVVRSDFCECEISADRHCVYVVPHHAGRWTEEKPDRCAVQVKQGRRRAVYFVADERFINSMDCGKRV